jgi:AcrR family transcriptional regulator
MTIRNRWLDEGLAVLAEQGARGVRVDRIAARLGLTKGSFHHHFDGIGDYHRSLLGRYESEAMDAISTAMAAVSDLPPERALMELPSQVSFDPRIEAAIRGWAFENEEANRAQARVDTVRLDALVSLWQRILHDPARARTAALVPHLLMIGASVALPRPSEKDVHEVFSLLATLVPAVQ